MPIHILTNISIPTCAAKTLRQVQESGFLYKECFTGRIRLFAFHRFPDVFPGAAGVRLSHRAHVGVLFEGQVPLRPIWASLVLLIPVALRRAVQSSCWGHEAI